MARGMLVAFTNPASLEANGEYQRWYDEVHLKEVLASGEFVRGARFKAVKRVSRDGLEQVGAVSPGAFLAIYEIDSEDSLDEVAGRVLARIAETTPSSANDASTAHGVFYELITDWTEPVSSTPVR